MPSHLVALANQALTDVRRRVTWDTQCHRGRKTDPAWAARRRLLRGRERPTGSQFTKMRNDLIDGDSTGLILTAWIAKEELLALLATARTGGQRHDVAHRLQTGVTNAGTDATNRTAQRCLPQHTLSRGADVTDIAKLGAGAPLRPRYLIIGRSEWHIPGPAEPHDQGELSPGCRASW